jgi:long-chain fatty acid transport protein
MKKRLGLLAALLFVAGNVYAGSIDYLSNQSAEYIRMFSRNAATDGADIAVYNPAATAFLKKGLYVSLSNQTVFKTYEDDFKFTPDPTWNGNYKSTKPTPILPSLFAIYNGGNWAGFFAAGATAGGGGVEYSKGVPTFATLWYSIYGKTLAAGASIPVAAATADGALGGKYVAGSGSLEANSFSPFATIGGSYAINDMISFSLAGRMVWGLKTYKAKGTYGSRVMQLDAEEDAFGIGGIIGLEVKPVKDLVVSGRYETQTIQNWKTKINGGKNFATTTGTPLLFADGRTHRKDLPAMLGLGVSYSAFDRLTAIVSYDLFFIGQADQKKDTADTIYTDGYNDAYDKYGYEASIGLDFAVIPNFLKVSAGYMYVYVGGNKKTYNDFDFSLNSNTYCLGAKVSPVNYLDLVLGLSNTRYISKKDSSGYDSYKKMAYVIALSAEYKMQ